MEFEIYNLGNITLQSGEILTNAKLAYKTYGLLNEAKDNVILYPTWYSGFISDNEWLIGNKLALNPDKYFIIVVSGNFCKYFFSMSTTVSLPFNTSAVVSVFIKDLI